MVMLPLPDDLDAQGVGDTWPATGFEQASVGSPSVVETPDAFEAFDPALPETSHPASSSVGVLDSSDMRNLRSMIELS